MLEMLAAKQGLNWAGAQLPHLWFGLHHL